MLPSVSARHIEIENACRQFGVARLDVFGSAASGSFETANSDLDFLVSFDERARSKAFDNYFGLRERLEEIFRRPIDLVTSASVKNPYFLREIEAQRQPVYVAQA